MSVFEEIENSLKGPNSGLARIACLWGVVILITLPISLPILLGLYLFDKCAKCKKSEQ